jgi:hypothetical protein
MPSVLYAPVQDRKRCELFFLDKRRQDLWFIAGTELIAALAILVGGKGNEDDR